jgi:hypothetical protein
VRESAIRSKILRYLNSLPNSDFEVSPPGSPTGAADIVGCLNGRYVACEVKVPGKEARPAQRYWLRKKYKAGAIVFVAHSVEEAKRELEYAMNGQRVG